MTGEYRNIQQDYWRDPDVPHMNLRSTANSDKPYKKHSHREFSIGAVTQGCTQTLIRNQQHTVNQGQLVVVEPELAHNCNPPAGKRRSYHMMYLEPLWCLQKMSELYGQKVERIFCHHRVIENPELFDKYLVLVDATRQQTSVCVTQLLEEFCFLIFSRYCSPVSKMEEGNASAEYVKSRLLDDLADPPSLEELGDELKQTRESIIRTFNRQLGISPMAFLNNARIEQAKLMLKAGVEIIDTALQVGFSDQSHFHKTFVNYTSSTPRQYQKINF